MDNFVIRKIASHEVDSAMALALEVFVEFEAPDYGPDGVETFKKDIVENPDYLENARNGICPIYGAFDSEELVARWGCVAAKRISIWRLPRRNTTEKASQERFLSICCRM